MRRRQDWRRSTTGGRKSKKETKNLETKYEIEMSKDYFFCSLEEEAIRADRVAAIAEEEAKRFNQSS